ncbi:PAS domain-containing protein [Massilia sp. S19_KUP03_FR1]|uniref:PAS domain-containing protein n=1 Tax=Massilia sp. S19_KUP03_FR1 TaxID=3025503 RepID=UPI002FCDDF28
MADFSGAFAHTLGSSAVAAEILAHDWARSAFGPLEVWPRWQKAALAMVMRSPTPMALLFGADGLLLYNDGYRVVLGDRHPAVLGSSVRAAWPEAASFNDDVVKQVLGGASLCYRDQPFRIARGGAIDERWFDLDYSPLFDDHGQPAAVLAVVIEQTALKHANAALRESQQRLDHAQAAGRVGTFTLELGTGTLFTTSGFNRIFGLPDQPSVDVATVEALIMPDDGEAPSNAANRADQSSPLQVEYRIRRPDDGALRWILRRAGYEHDSAGVADRMVGVVQDVTERKAGELALAESAAQFQTLTQALPNLVWSANPQGDIDWMNARACEYSGLAPGVLMGGGLIGIVQPDDAPEAARAWRNCVASGALYETEYRIRRADGQYRWHLVRALPQRGPNGRIDRWIGTSTDIDERKRLETHNKRALNRIWGLSQELMLICDFSGAIAAVNPSAARLLGWSEEQMIGKYLADFVHPDDLASTAAEVAKLSEGVTTLAFENRYRASDGSYRLLDWTAVPDNGMIHAVGRDVTRERVAEEALRQSQKLEAIGMLTGGVAHDFNNVLAVVRTSIDLLRLVPLDVERRKRYMDAISDAVTRAARLTGQLLAFARRQSLQPEVFDAGRNVQMVSEMIGSLTGARIRMDYQVAPDACFVDADPSQFDTAIVNLAVNARDAMDGSGKLTISVGQSAMIPAVRGQAAVHGPFVAVAVRDTGKGIPPEMLSQIFEPFFTTKGSGHGTGLGLSQVFGFAKQSGGEIVVNSSVGVGTEFTLYLPRAADPGAGVQAPTQAQGLVRGDGRCILVVEDNQDLGVIVRQSLEELDYTTVMTTSAEQALEELAADAGRFAAVFSDVVMNGMGGFALGQQLRRMYPALPLVLSSGYSAVLASEHKHGFQLLPKPYSLAELAQTLHQAIAGTGAAARAAPVPPPAVGLAGRDQELFRLAELDRLQILDTKPEGAFDALTRLAAERFDVPIALISLVDDRRQWFKSRLGVDASETAREHAFCAHTIRTPGEVMLVPDATRDARFAANPLVTSEPGIRFYAGAPLVTSAGHALGTLCVIDRKPRTLTPDQVTQLRALADQVVGLIEARGRAAEKMAP